MHSISASFRRTLLASAALCASLAACKVGPDYHAADQHLPAGWLAAGAASPADGDASLQENWWGQLHDPVLDALIAKAAAGNEDVKMARARINEARGIRASAKSDLLPTINSEASGIREGNRVAFGGTAPFDLTKPFNNFQAGFDATWELDLFGGRRRVVEGDTAQIRADEADEANVRVTLFAEVARNYAQALTAQAQLATVLKIAASDRETLKIAQELYRTGNSPRLDALQAEAQLNDALTQKPYYENLIADSELSLDVLMGETPGHAAAMIPATRAVPTPDSAPLLAAPSRVIAHRPDVVVAERRLAGATAQQGVAVARFYPDISLSGFFGVLTTDIDKLFDKQSKSYDFGANIAWPILSYNQLSANFAASKARVEQARATYRKSVLQALADVERSVTAYTKERQFLDSTALSAAENQHALAIARERYKAGITTFLEVLTAERTSDTSEIQLTGAKGQTFENWIAVYKSLGGAWTANQTPAALNDAVKPLSPSPTGHETMTSGKRISTMVPAETVSSATNSAPATSLAAPPANVAGPAILPTTPLFMPLPPSGIKK